jgi:hypothetical protein
MGLWDSIRNLGNRVSTGLARTVGQIAHGVRRVADTTKPILMGAARFVRDNHAPLAMVAKGVGDMSGNDTMRAIGNAAMSASGMYGARQAQRGRTE